MAQKIENAARELLKRICGRERETPDWLMRPERVECSARWPLTQDVYRKLMGNRLPKTMPPHEWRKVDGVFLGPGKRLFIFELDEKQHFNRFRTDVAVNMYFAMHWRISCLQGTASSLP